MLLKLKNNEKGFSLLELSVAVGIAAIVAAVAITATTAFVNGAADNATLYEATADQAITDAQDSFNALGQLDPNRERGGNSGGGPGEGFEGTLAAAPVLGFNWNGDGTFAVSYGSGISCPADANLAFQGEVILASQHSTTTRAAANLYTSVPSSPSAQVGLCSNPGGEFIPNAEKTGAAWDISSATTSGESYVVEYRIFDLETSQFSEWRIVGTFTAP